MPKPMEELKLRIRKTGMYFREFADKIKVTPVSLSHYLNGYSPMPDHVRKDIERVLLEVESEN